MASVTLAESGKLTQNTLVAGVIESIVTVNNVFQLLPFDEIEGNALAYDRENALGDVQTAGVDTSITAKNPATFTQVTSSLTTIIGDAEVNGLIQATRSNINDQRAVQIASKAKSCGRKYQDMLINGTGSGNDMTGLLALVASGQFVAPAADAGNGAPLAFSDLDNLLDQVKDKDGEVDWIAMNARTIRSYFALLRALGGANIDQVVTLPSGTQVPAYRGVPILRNDWIPINQTRGSSNSTTTVLAGTFDDGSRKYGISGLTAMNDAAGIQIVDVGESEFADNSITRVKWYCGLANFNELGLAALRYVTN